MKKLLLCSLIGFASPSYADFIGLYGKVGVWNAGFEGTVSGTEDKKKREANNQTIPSFETRGLDNDNHITGWVAFEHPTPFIPNIRLGYTGVKSSGLSTENISTDKITATINGVPNVTYDAGQPIYTTMQFDAIDVTAYWEVLDNWLNLDLGLTLRKMDGDFSETVGETPFPARVFGGSDGCGGMRPEVVSYGVGTALGCVRPETTKVTPIDILIPMIYAKGQFDIPFTGAYVAATLQGMSASGNSMVDIDIETGYNFNLTVMDIGASIGYREATLNAKDLDDLYAKDAKLSGVYGALNIHF
jgi:outer membrane protein